MDTGIQNTVQSKPVFIWLDVLDTEIQNTVLNEPVCICLDVLENGIQDSEQIKPVFDPEIHTELMIKDEFEDIKEGD